MSVWWTVASEGELIVVPGFVGTLARVPDVRKRALRQHLRTAIADARRCSANMPPDDARSTADAHSVLRRACTTCKGRCCGNGGDDAYLDDTTIKRVMSATPRMTPTQLLKVYVGSIPVQTYEGSCIYHGAHGCGLDRTLRSQLCNDFYCSSLTEYLRLHPIEASANVSFVRGPARSPQRT